MVCVLKRRVVSCRVLDVEGLLARKKPISSWSLNLLPPGALCASSLRIVRPATMPTNLGQFRKAKNARVPQNPNQPGIPRCRKQREPRKKNRETAEGQRAAHVLSCTHPHHVSALSPSRSADPCTQNWSANLVRSEDVSRSVKDLPNGVPI